MCMHRMLLDTMRPLLIIILSSLEIIEVFLAWTMEYGHGNTHLESADYSW